MTRIEVSGVTGEQLAKRMLKLAWDASRVLGFGILQDKGGGLSEELLWERGCDNQGPAKAGKVAADYLMGRMMKLYFSYNENFIEIRYEDWRNDYQSFYPTYPSFTVLAIAAAQTLGATIHQDI